MKKFEFSLETVLKHREQQEVIAHQNLRLIEKLLNHETDNLVKLLDELKTEIQLLTIYQKSSTMGGIMRDSHSYIEDLHKKIRQQELVIAKAGKEMNHFRYHLLEVMQKRKIIDNIRKRRLDEYEEKDNRLENKAQDELATIRYNQAR